MTLFPTLPDSSVRRRASGAVLATILAACLGPPVAAQEPAAGAAPTLTISRLESAPRIDAFLAMRPDDETARRMAHVSGFTQREPEDGKPASQETDVYLGYDQENFYAVFVAHDRNPELIRANLAPRENVFGDEIVEVQLDTFRDQRRAYTFIANPLGVQWDAIWTEGNRFDESFDTVWESEGRLTDTGYVVLMSIPFKSLRFSPEERQTWGIILVRDIPRNNESSFWPRVTNRIEGRMQQAAILEGLEGISPGKNMQFIPYFSARSFTLLEEDQPGKAGFLRERSDEEIGIDAKFVFKDSLALDLTLEPDFAQVESDEPQVTVNQRFEVFFPEKRPFFLENAGFFATRFNLLFTRRIADPSAGARLTGKMGRYSLGALLIDDESPGKVVPPGDPLSGESARFGAVRVSRDVMKQSNVGFLYTERTFDGEINRVGSVDGRFKVGRNWDSNFQAVTSSSRLDDGSDQSGPAYSLDFNRSGRRYNSHIHYLEIDPEFRTDAGFIPRVDIRDFHQDHNFRWRPEGPRLLAWGPGLFVQRIDDQEGTRLDRNVTANFEWQFRRQTEIFVFKSFKRERLRPTDFPTLTSDRDFSTDEYGFSFRTRFTNRFNADVVYEIADAINFVPPAGAPPSPASQVFAEVELTVKPLSRLRTDTVWLFTRLSDDDTGDEIFTNQIFRSRWNLQFTVRASLRLIAQYEVTRVDPDLTSLGRRRNMNYDLLFTYRVNPWTAVFAGYNTNFQNVDLARTMLGREIVPTRRDLLNDAEQIFVKISYLFRP